MKTNFRNTDKIAKLQHTVYNYLLEHNHIGKEMGVTRLVLARLLDIDERDLREAMRQINMNPEFERFVSTSFCVYLCDSDFEDNCAIGATVKQLSALALKARAMIKKKQARGQVRIPLTAEEYDAIVDVFTRGE